MSGKLIDLRRRIKSVRNTQKITRAMKSVSAAKLKKAVGWIHRNDFYLKEMKKIIEAVLSSVDDTAYPLLQPGEEDRPELIIAVSSDKGLCGAFNSRVIEFLRELISGREKDYTLIPVGKKIRRYVEKSGFPVLDFSDDLIGRLTFRKSLKFSEMLKKYYLKGDFSSVSMVTTRYISSGSQKVVHQEVFPFPLERGGETDEDETVDYITEPSAGEIFESAITEMIDSWIYRLLLESVASEQTARMVAMENATSNADEMIRSLTLTMNKVRQEAITTELLDIISATEAMT